MKKLIVFFLLIVPVVLVFITRPICQELFNLDGVTKACVVTKSDIKEDEGLSTLQYNYIFSDYKDLEKSAERYDVSGIILYFNEARYQSIIKSLNMLELKRENIDNKIIIYGYTPSYNNSIIMENKKVNAEMVVEGKSVVVGFPVILSGF